MGSPFQRADFPCDVSRNADLNTVTMIIIMQRLEYISVHMSRPAGGLSGKLINRTRADNEVDVISDPPPSRPPKT